MSKRFLAIFLAVVVVLGLSGWALAGNTGGVTPTGGDGNIAELNEAYINVLGDFNDTCQRQNGNNNYAYLDLAGDSNTAEQVQLGNDNWASTTIEGNSNSAHQHQEGGNQKSTIIIRGSHNSARVTQTR